MVSRDMKWREIILDVLSREQNAVPGRAGETPLNNLAIEFSRLAGQRDLIHVVSALKTLVEDPDAALTERDNKEYWRTLSFLTKYLPETPEKDILQKVFRARLFDEHMRNQGVSVFALHGFIAARGRLTPEDLDRLVEIKDNAPVAWLGAAAMSSLFVFARENAIKLLKDGRINLKSFLIGMDAWREIWDSRDDFGELMKQFQKAVPDTKGKAKFTKWLERRGYVNEALEHSSVPERSPLPPNMSAFVNRQSKNSNFWSRTRAHARECTV